MLRVFVRKLPISLYFLLLVFGTGWSAPVRAKGPDQVSAYATLSSTQQAMVDDLERRTFEWFWQTADPKTGLVPDSAPGHSFSSIAAVGFGLTAYGVGVERGYITREQAAQGTLATLRFFHDSPQNDSERF